jgi:hypothetical protein
MARQTATPFLLIRINLNIMKKLDLLPGRGLNKRLETGNLQFTNLNIKTLSEADLHKFFLRLGVDK